jgi:glycosyltransferase involved in cell wall biosynthesis
VTTLPRVSVLVPCRNERLFIARCLSSILANDYPTTLLEILVIDGASDDGTTDVIRSIAATTPHLRLLPNERGIVPAALNLGIAEASGEVIIRMDAHNEYPPNYISALVDWLEKTGADNVGGAWVTRPANGSTTARAIASALTHRFGVGNAQYRLGEVTSPRRVDTVPFGCFRKELFARIGLFDEELIRNQDDEFNCRLLKAGGSIMLVPGVVSYYYARSSYRSLARMYYQYGFFKPLVAWKTQRVMTIRQLIPAAFVAALSATALLVPWFPMAGRVLIAFIGIYLATAVLVSFRSGWGQGWRFMVALCAAFPVLHLSYGVGWIAGALRLATRGGHPAVRPDAVPLSR